MRDFERKRKMESTLYSPAVIVVLCILIALIARSLVSAYQKSTYSQEEARRLAIRLASLQTEAERLESTYKFLDTKEGVEAELRSKYRVVSPGEKVAIIVNNESKSATGKNNISGVSVLKTNKVNSVPTTDGTLSDKQDFTDIQTEDISWWQAMLQKVGIGF